MRKITTIIFGLTIIALLAGCGGGSTMHQTKSKGPGGMPAIQPQVTKDDRGKDAINLTEELIYPGSAPFEGAKYQYVTADAPQKVADWFAQNLSGSTVNTKKGSDATKIIYEITWKGLIIVVDIGPNGSDSLIIYKKPIKSGAMK